MVRIGKWVLTLGILAVAPGLAVAASYPWQADTDTAAAANQKSRNQQVAESIALALKKSSFHGYEIDIEYRNGLATLRGKVSDPRQKVRASQIVSSVGGVQKVDNRLTVVAPSEGSIRQVTATNADTAAPAQQASAEGQPAQMSANQEKAMQIGHALQQAGLNGYDIQIMFQNGRCVLQGMVGTAEQRNGAAQVAGAVPGVQAVSNQLRFQGQPGAPGGPGAPGPFGVQGSPYGQPQSPYQMAAYQAPPGGAAPVGPPGAGAEGMPGPVPPMGAPIPATGPGPQSSAPAYDNPNLPQYGWPSYAQYPNYAAVTYPSQYSASAWPYIGPFYPYPQVPLNWRKVTLEWSDGHWDLNFDSRTDRWWWFLNPKNW
jgi:osmotically-inducible protein OsmY